VLKGARINAINVTVPLVEIGSKRSNYGQDHSMHD